ncbi:MAG TPA: type II toxin-antitoxin system HicB family antitoxin [Candidatus Omnitrophica bacterium]|nr:type II toxin-antitoxin system HicB family antitoxin [Candidatus Omnitrophota bacterium]
MEIKVVFEKDEDGMYVVTCPSLPGCVSQGRTEKEALKNIREAIRLHVKCLAEDGLPLSRPKGAKERLIEVMV